MPQDGLGPLRTPSWRKLPPDLPPKWARLVQGERPTMTSAPPISAPKPAPERVRGGRVARSPRGVPDAAGRSNYPEKHASGFANSPGRKSVGESRSNSPGWRRLLRNKYAACDSNIAVCELREMPDATLGAPHQES